MVKVSKPGWVRHQSEASSAVEREAQNGKTSSKHLSPIMSVDIQPGEKRFATGGQDGKIKLWDFQALFQPHPERSKAADTTSPLAVLCEHASSVNCVRWSTDPEGEMLASGSDDCCVNLWVYTGLKEETGSGGNSGFSFKTRGENSEDKEEWKAVVTFKGHSMDVTSLAWSPDAKLLASCSVDNTVRIWTVESSFKNRQHRTVSTDVEVVLKGHSGWVKGVTWDPVGVYLATASDDKSVIIWRTNDWQEETRVTKPLEKGSMTTFKRQIAWSPEGVFLCITHAYEHPKNVAYVVERSKWHESENAVRFVGHPKPVSLASFSPAIYQSRKPGQRLSTVCAIGCNGRYLTLWSPGRNRALAVFRNLFDEKLLDLAWSRDGYNLMACSMDGKVACLRFEEFDRIPEVGKPLSRREVANILRKNYGDVAIGRTEPSLPETAEQLIMEEQAQEKLIAAKPSVTAEVVQEQEERVKARQVQTETRTASGKRRIAPAFLSGPANPVKKAKVPQPVRTNRLKRARLEGAFTNPSYRHVLQPAMLKGDQGTYIDRSSGHTCVLRVKAVETSAGKHECILKKLVDGKVVWTSKVEGKPACYTGNLGFSAMATTSGELYLFGKLGQLLVAPIQLALPLASLVSSSGESCFLLATLCNASVFVWNVYTLVAVVASALVDPLLSLLNEQSSEGEDKQKPAVGINVSEKASPNKSILVDFAVTKQGIPVVTIVKPRAEGDPNTEEEDLEYGRTRQAASYGFSTNLQAWCRVSDPLRFIDSDFYSNLVASDKLNDTLSQSVSHRSVLHNIHTFTTKAARHFGVLDAREQVDRILSSEASTQQEQADKSRAHVESLIASTVLLASKTEYISWLQAYCTRLCESSDIPRLEALCKSLLGPVAVTTKATRMQLDALQEREESIADSASTEIKEDGLSEWQPVVLGIDKRKLLAETVLPILAKNRELQRLSNRFFISLKEVEPKSAAKENLASNALLEERMKQR